ncbi:hypothetical protein [Deinococcus sonorensis]|uniref:Uncharacterized protein n=2 Tax=Deinococcus sonorensis TaxID=309891 RepID=A0AAU7U828_9DEIO
MAREVTRTPLDRTALDTQVRWLDGQRRVRPDATSGVTVDDPLTLSDPHWQACLTETLRNRLPDGLRWCA